MEAPETGDSLDIEETTQRYSQRDIERLRQRAAQPDPIFRRSIEEPSADEGGEEAKFFELDGRRYEVSLSAFADIGNAGGHPRTIGSTRKNPVSGQFSLGGAGSASSSDADEPADRRRPALRRAVAALTIVGLAVFAGWISLAPGSIESTPTPAERTLPPAEPEPPRERVDPVAQHVAPAPPPAPATSGVPSGDTPTRARKRSRSTDESASQECIDLRERSQLAFATGDWALLEQLTRRQRCWRRPSEAKALRMRALFELGRHQECVEIGRGDRSKKVIKWFGICQRASR